MFARTALATTITRPGCWKATFLACRTARSWTEAIFVAVVTSPRLAGQRYKARGGRLPSGRLASRGGEMALYQEVRGAQRERPCQSGPFLGRDADGDVGAWADEGVDARDELFFI
jgi:hypothetical protein